MDIIITGNKNIIDIVNDPKLQNENEENDETIYETILAKFRDE